MQFFQTIIAAALVATVAAVPNEVLLAKHLLARKTCIMGNENDCHLFLAGLCPSQCGFIGSNIGEGLACTNDCLSLAAQNCAENCG